MNPIACVAHQIKVEPVVLSHDGAGRRALLAKASVAEGRYIGERAGWLDCVIWRQQRSRMEHLASSATKTSPQPFETHNLALAAFLIAGRHLRYLGTRAESGRATFVFEDLDGQGPKLEGEFLSGAECPATLFHSTVKRLRREIDEGIVRKPGDAR